MGAATVDITGRWLVTVQDIRRDRATLWNVVQAGNSVTYTDDGGDTGTGTIDITTGALTFPPREPGPCSPTGGLDLQTSADGETFTGVKYYQAQLSNFQCFEFGVLVTGSRCSDSGSTTGCAMVPGGGSAAADCLHEWITPRGAVPGTSGPGATTLVCTENDPTCDFGLFRFDRACTFALGMCFNVADGALPCAASGVRTVRFIRPGSRSHSAAAADARAALESALTQAGAHVQGICVNGFTGVGVPCTTNGDCDTSGSPGVCRRLVTIPPELSAANVCTPLAMIRVSPGPRGRPGKLTLRIKSNGSPRAAHAMDTDRLTLICRRRR